jgi:anti-anti-sigma factor
MAPGMMGTPLDIHETQENGWLRLSLAGELDLGSVPVLDDRLSRLRARKLAVHLDLSKLEFIDSTGLRLLIRALGDARIERWDFQIEPDLTPAVRGLFKLVHLDHVIGPAERSEQAIPPPPSARDAGD